MQVMQFHINRAGYAVSIKKSRSCSVNNPPIPPWWDKGGRKRGASGYWATCGGLSTKALARCAVAVAVKAGKAATVEIKTGFGATGHFPAIPFYATGESVCW